MGLVFRNAAALPLFFAACCGSFCAGAAAQGADGEAPLPTIPVGDDAPPPVPPATADDAREDAITTVIVTGELIDRPVERTTSSVSVHSGDDIERSTARSVYDVVSETPNASLDDSDYGVGSMTLRGIASYGASGSGAYAAYSTSSAVVYDGVGLPRSALSIADLSAFDLDSVEILRGPQSTSQGRNAMAGAVIINTAVPRIGSGFAPEVRGRFSGGNAGNRQYAGAVGATLWPDALALRVTYDDRADDGDITNTTRGDKDWAKQRSRSLRARANWQPFGADGAYQALLSYGDLKRYAGSSYVQEGEADARVSVSDAPQYYQNHSQLAALDQRLRLGERWRLRAVSAYIRSDTPASFDGDYTADANIYSLTTQLAHAFSQELRFYYAGERLQSTFGAYFYKDRNDYDTSGYLNIASVLGAGQLPLGNIVYATRQPPKVEDMAVFGEADYALTPRFTVTAGLRVDREKNSRTMSSDYGGDSVASELIVQGLMALGTLPANGPPVHVSREFSDVLPKLALRYELFDGWYLGAAYTQGYRPGGDGYNPVSARYFSFDAEQTHNYEISFKGHYTPWHLDSALNLFYTRWNDMQIQLGSGTDNYMGNAGPANIRGGELELRWQPWRALRVIGGFGVSYGRFADDMPPVADGENLAGKRLPQAPPYSASLALEWMPLPGLTIRPDARWTGTTPTVSDNAAGHEIPSYCLLNLALRWQIGHFGLFVTGTNLNDERWLKDANSYSAFAGPVVSLGESRRISGGIEVEF